MKKVLHYLLALTLTCNASMLYATSDYEYITKEAYGSEDLAHQEPTIRHKHKLRETGPIKASSEALATSMMGWGIGLATAILILSGVIHNSPNPNPQPTKESS